MTLLAGIIMAFVWAESPQPPILAVFLILLPFVACALALISGNTARNILITRAVAVVLIAMSASAASSAAVLYLPGLGAMVIAILEIRPRPIARN